MRDAIGAHGAPATANSDQGSVYGSAACEQLLKDSRVPQSVDGKARWVGNVIVGRWFRSPKSECVKIGGYETPRELRGSSTGTLGSTTTVGFMNRWITRRQRHGTIRE